MAITTITKDNFSKEVLSSDLPVLVDFWATWCGPCRMLAPTIEEIADENKNIKVCKVNVDDNPELAAQFSIMSIPTLLVFKNGKVSASSVGLISKDSVLKLLDR